VNMLIKAPKSSQMTATPNHEVSVGRSPNGAHPNVVVVDADKPLDKQP